MSEAKEKTAEQLVKLDATDRPIGYFDCSDILDEHIKPEVSHLFITYESVGFLYRMVSIKSNERDNVNLSKNDIINIFGFTPLLKLPYDFRTFGRSVVINE